MVSYNDNREQRREERKERRQFYMTNSSRHSHIWTGLFILLVGVAALIKASVTDLPSWLFGWQTFLIALGIFIGFKHGFRGGAWFILILVGSAFLLRDIYRDLANRRDIWPMP